MSNKNLHIARSKKNDEFYTQLCDIEKELQHYTSHFKGKSVYCNCDDPESSNFFKYFSLNFESLGLRRLITTCYRPGQKSAGLSVEAGGEVRRFELEGRRRFP